MSGYEEGGSHESSWEELSNFPATSSYQSQGIVDRSTTVRGGGRPRGRPPGSKNKLKRPMVVAQATPSSLRSQLLEVSSGADLVESLSAYARQKGRGVSVLSANGTVQDVTLRNCQSQSQSHILKGQFEILSLMGTVLPPPAPAGAGGLSIMVSRGKGQMVGGNVVGRLIAWGPVLVVMASFPNAIFERLPLPSDTDSTHLHSSHDEGISTSTFVEAGTRYSLPFMTGEGDHHNVLG